MTMLTAAEIAEMKERVKRFAELGVMLGKDVDEYEWERLKWNMANDAVALLADRERLVELLRHAITDCGDCCELCDEIEAVLKGAPR